MMKFNEYYDKIEELDEMENLLRNKLDYRTIELIGPRPMVDMVSIRRNTLGDEEEKKIDSDLIVIELRRQIKNVQDIKRHIRYTGECPEATEEMLKSWEKEVWA